MPDQILQDTFVQHVKAVCIWQFRLEARTETLDQHRDRMDEGNAPDHERRCVGSMRVMSVMDQLVATLEALQLLFNLGFTLPDLELIGVVELHGRLQGKEVLGPIIAF